MTKNSNQKRTKRDNGAGSINYLEARKRWCANIQIGYNVETGKAKRKAIYGKTEAEVKRKLKEFKKERESKTNITGSTMTLSEFLDYWFIEYQLNRLSKSYYDRLQSVYKHHIKPNLGHIMLSQLTKKHIQKLIDDGNKAGYARASLKKIAEILRPALKTCVDEHLLDKSPFDGVKIPPEDKMKRPTKEITIYSDRQKEKLLSKIDENFINSAFSTFRYLPVFSFILNTGLREGELLALKWKHLKQTEDGHTVATIFENITYVHERDADGNAVRRILNTGKLKGKCKKREIPLNEKALKALEQMKQSNEHFGTVSEYIFSNTDGTCSTAGRLIRSLNHLARLADVPYLGVHSLRHSFASALLKKGVSVKVVSEILGHSDAYFTANVYIHIDTDQKLDAVNSL